MKQKLFFTITVLLFVGCATNSHNNRIVRVAVIGGMMKSGLWSELASRFENKTGYKIELVASGNREICAETLRAGRADLIAIHASTVASNLVADGYGRNMRTWTRNEFVILGPATDPAGIRGLKDGANALAKIADRQSPFVDFQNSGTRDIAAALREKAGIVPRDEWLLRDDSDSSEEVIEFAAKKNAYLILGRIPVTLISLKAKGMDILVQGDPLMRRSFVVVEANPAKSVGANTRAARLLSRFLLSDDSQNFLIQFGTNTPGQMPLFYPVAGR